MGGGSGPAEHDIMAYRTALDLLHRKYIESYSAIWGHIALFILHCTCLHVLQVNMCFLYVQMRRIQILHCYICQVLL